jgi:hypothetical protein
VEGKEHLSVEGLNKIVSIKSCMNGNGLSDKLKKEFPALPIMTRPIWEVSSLGEKAIYDPCWLAGFIDAEGCFFVHIRKSAGYKVGYQVSLIFQVSQDMKDKELLQILVKFFGCGKVWASNKKIGAFKVESVKDILTKVIPLLESAPLLGTKAKDYVDFKQVAFLIKEKAHTTQEGLDKILKIKGGMNRARAREGDKD